MASAVFSDVSAFQESQELPHLSLSLLGGFNILFDGQPVTTLRTDKVRALLAYLAIESDRPQRRAVLAGLIWPEMPQEKAAHNLRQSILFLRRALHEDEALAAARPPFLLLTGQDIQFNPYSDYQLDVAYFLELLRAVRQHRHAAADSCQACLGWLRQAADLYRGDLLAGFSLRDSVPFEEWQLVQKEALHGQVLEVLGRLAAYYERRGEPVKMLEYARRLVSLEPWQEQAQMQVMTALAQTGQEAGALEQYMDYSRTLAQEFGIAASPEVTALYERIRSRQLTDRFARGTATGISTMPDERRQVTALLCHWQGSTDRSDPEEMQEDLARFNQSLIEISERYEGTRQLRQGAETLIYFGYPVAQEDAARRAVDAGLALIAAVRDIDHVRVGIHTGMMVSRGAELVGNVPDLARDCLRLAAPNSVLITADTERLVRGRFTCQPIEHSDPIEQAPVYQVQGESADNSRLTWPAQTRRITRLVGRETELQQLAACMDRVLGGQGQVITVCGDPGIGKTRLTREFKKIYPGPATWLESHCSPYFQNTSLYPIISLLEQFLGFEPDDDAALKRDKLASALARCDLDHPDTTRSLSLLLGLPTDTPPRTVTEDQRERMREACVAWLQREAARQPVMLLIEDLHWADPTTIAWLGRSLDALAAARCVLWLNWRPEFVAPWLPGPHLLALDLEPLSPLQAASMVSDVVSQWTLADDVHQQIVRQADGIPLYVEELAHAFHDTTTFETSAAPQTLPIPATLRDVLTARLDRAGAAKETAQWAALLGREFAYSILRASVPYAEQRLQDDLAALLNAGLLEARDGTAHTDYAFKHALIQEAAYDSLLRRARQDHHRHIAETLVTHFPRLVETEPEVLAQHYSQAGLSAQAVDQWMRAGERSAARGATLEARTFFDQALAALNPVDLERHWRVLLAREAVLDLREERAAQREDIEALLELAEALDDDLRRAQARVRQASYGNRMEDYQLMLQASEAAATAAARQGDLTLEVQALARKVVALARLERREAARPIVEKTLAKMTGITDDVVQSNILGDLSLYYSDGGDVARALRLQKQGIELARRVGDRSLESRRLMSAGYHYSRLGRYAEARAAYEAGLTLAESVGDRFLQTNLRFDLCYVLWCNGDPDGARALGERALQELKTSGYRPFAVATCLAYLGVILEGMADYHTAAAYLAESRALFVGRGQHGAGMEAQAIEARCQLALGQWKETQQLASQVWAFLGAHGTVTMDYPSRVYLCIADVVAQIAMPEITEREVLAAGYAELVQKAEMIDDPAWRRSFLEDELSNRALAARWKCLNLTVSGGDETGETSDK